MYKDAAPAAIDQAMQQAWDAFLVYRQTSLAARAGFMRAIADALEQISATLIPVTMRETNLPEARLRNELTRTKFQLTSYAAACERGDWLDASIDTAITDRNPPKPDLRKMMVPLGPVVVFGAANFPYAYSTAGGDTASALAAGCPVIVKAHPAHPETSELVAGAILQAIRATGMPAGVFSHIHGVSFDVGRALIEHPLTKAAGFTGSLAGGRQLFDWANARKEPIPVFAEMSSINPVYLFPGKLAEDAVAVANMYAGSITLGMGQFCTKPGLLIGIASTGLNQFATALAEAMRAIQPAAMLHEGIVKNYYSKKAAVLQQTGVEQLAASDTAALGNQGQPVLAKVSGKVFLANPALHQEVFGPFSLLIECADAAEMLAVAKQMEGQLTSTLMATTGDLHTYASIADAIQYQCGRIVLNGVPTGVEVCLSMQHGGPYPATTDVRFGAVGADAIRRFVRPLSFQNWPDASLPAALQNSNPLGIWRTVNDERTKAAIN